MLGECSSVGKAQDPVLGAGKHSLRLLDTQAPLSVAEELRMEWGPTGWIWSRAGGRGKRGVHGSGLGLGFCRQAWWQSWLRAQMSLLWEIRRWLYKQRPSRCPPPPMADPGEKRQSIVLRHLLSWWKVDE